MPIRIIGKDLIALNKAGHRHRYELRHGYCSRSLNIQDTIVVITFTNLYPSTRRLACGHHPLRGIGIIGHRVRVEPCPFHIAQRKSSSVVLAYLVATASQRTARDRRVAFVGLGLAVSLDFERSSSSRSVILARSGECLATAAV
jgi:hypothetical protein